MSKVPGLRVQQYRHRHSRRIAAIPPHLPRLETNTTRQEKQGFLAPHIKFFYPHIIFIISIAERERRLHAAHDLRAARCCAAARCEQLQRGTRTHHLVRCHISVDAIRDFGPFQSLGHELGVASAESDHPRRPAQAQNSHRAQTLERLLGTFQTRHF